MPGLEPYSPALSYSYCTGLFPCMELMRQQPASARRLLTASDAPQSEGLRQLQALCEKYHVRQENADRVLRRISGKENCIAALVFEKTQIPLDPQKRHLVLHHPGDMGNLGTILRSALGFGFRDLAVIRPAADVFDPRVVRSSMGALFGLRVMCYNDFGAYRAEYPAHSLFPFMLDASIPPEQAAAGAGLPYALIMGNEGSGLPAEFAGMGQPVRIPHSGQIDSLNLAVAASIGMYVFSQYTSPEA